MVNPFSNFFANPFLPSIEQVSGGKSTSIRDSSVVDQRRAGLVNIGGESTATDQRTFQSSSSVINEGDTITNISNSAVEGFSISQRRTTDISPVQTASPSFIQEKPLQISPSLIGGSSAQATGEAEASATSGLNPLLLGALAIAGVIGFQLFKKNPIVKKLSKSKK